MAHDVPPDARPAPAADLLPMLGLHITAGPVELRGITDDLLVEVAELAASGVHSPDWMPFTVPWTDAPAGELPRRFAQYHWQTRADFAPEGWTLNLAVLYEGELVGVQGISTSDYLVTRTGETGSWLGRAHQGRGIGTVMRQVMCAFCFDHLDAAEIASAAFRDNAASLGVSRKVGYVENGVTRVRRRDQVAEMVGLRLTREAFVRGPDPLSVSGVAPFRASIGLDPQSR